MQPFKNNHSYRHVNQFTIFEGKLEVGNGTGHYLGTILLVDSSINLIASDFFSGSIVYSISATAALCIKESAEKTNTKTTEDIRKMNAYAFFFYSDNPKSHLDVSPRNSCLPQLKTSLVVD